MAIQSPGKAFEEDVIRALRGRQKCIVFTSETLDLQHKIDGEIRSVDGRHLWKPVQVQLTRRVDHFGKLNAYLWSRWLNTDIVSLYVEVHDGPGVHEVAEHVAWAAVQVQRMELKGPKPVIGLRIDDDAAFYDPFERLKELQRERTSESWLAAMRTGQIYRYDESGFWIMDDDLKLHFAQLIDVCAASLRSRVRNRECPIEVRFKPTIPGRATDVRAIR